ncbi:MAG: hypothetical protein ABSH50_16975 [Bryobacteraceae bacterium]|jgi:hypothetical protein
MHPPKVSGTFSDQYRVLDENNVLSRNQKILKHRFNRIARHTSRRRLFRVLAFGDCQGSGEYLNLAIPSRFQERLEVPYVVIALWVASSESVLSNLNKA